ncbi:MAG: L-alanine exporter AlaE [Synergistaceae bacterium]|nr:L-alanine exporter AlaE [Synergistaceae bacterium]
MKTSKNQRMGRRERIGFLVADIAAMIIFSTAMCMFIEIFIAKLTLFQSITARIAAIPVNLITGRPYGWFRDRLFTTLGIDRTSTWKMILGDTVAFVIFQVPLYVIVLLLAEANWSQIAISSAFMTAAFSLAGRPYGIFLDFCRRLTERLILAWFPGEQK